MKKQRTFLRPGRIFLCAFFLAGFSGCGKGLPSAAFTDSDAPVVADPYYICGTKEEQETLKNCFSLLAAETESGPGQFALVREIANSYIRQKEYGKLACFLDGRVHENPRDPYNTYYLFMKAYGYQQMEANPVAALYFESIVKNYPDLKVEDKSIHLACLNQLITLVNNPQQQVWYYEQLVSRFPDKIDPGPAYFMLGQAYEGIGEWNNAIKAYTQYLSYAQRAGESQEDARAAMRRRRREPILTAPNVSGFANADSYARQLVDFNNSSKDWTFENLNTLVSAIKSALAEGSSRRLWQYHAKVNFFTRTWEQEEIYGPGITDTVLADFIRGGRIRYADTLDISSTANEAYLRTWGWAQYASGWYLYFRKINFPLDPEMHGRWEWAGIYYGEKF